MEDKTDFIKATIRQFLQVANKYAAIEELPIRVDDALTVTTREAHTIQAIGEGEPISVTDIASTLGISKSAASQMVTKLTAKELLRKEKSPHNNKEWQVSLTPSGWRAFEAHEQAHGKDLADLVERLSSFSLQQIATISVLLDSIGNVMDHRLDR